MEICRNPNHQKVYSTKRKTYICPFCEKNAATAYNIAKAEGITLYPYQEEILLEDGHRVLVGARQIGKTTVADLEVAAKSHRDKVIYLRQNRKMKFLFPKYTVDDNIMWRYNLSNVLLSEEQKKAKFLVIDDINYVDDIQEIHNLRIRENFTDSLICGTPSPNGVLKNISKFDYGKKQWQVSMRDCPNISPTDEGIARQSLNPGKEKREIDGEFT